jgi:hypothetical protein
VICPPAIYNDDLPNAHQPVFALSHHSTQITLSAPKMSTSKTIKQLVKQISALLNSLSDAVPKGTKGNKLWSVMNNSEGDTSHETFNCCFNALFEEDC